MTNRIYKTKNTSFEKFVKSKQSKNTQFEYLSGICGIGKTEVLIDHAIQEIHENQKKIIFAVPTTELCDEIGNRIQSKGEKPIVIHSKNNFGTNDSVTKRIIQTMCELNSDQGTIQVYTQEALRCLPYFPNNASKGDWTVIHDEAFDPTAYIELRLKDHRHYIDGVINVPKSKWHLPYVPATIPGEMNLSQQRAIIKNKNNDQFLEQLSDLYQHAENSRAGKCDIFVDMDAYRSFKEGDRTEVHRHGSL